MTGSAAKLLVGALVLGLGAAAPLTPADPACAAPACCRTCKSGKPCGDGCIAKDKHCDKPKGCACQG